ncbi:MAG: hypothetical protein CL943_03985 [Candidatus Diapherotrites archaeon]|uniref:C2H2-type domain-containing protein n=1 Tax=Candidatus Iainarchaeum sp. TaxID=3101447 RepID=A0A2D6M1W9_9ARCH|nr:hypothetical protein [Candidatus Diapherotrites archaeon]
MQAHENSEKFKALKRRLLLKRGTECEYCGKESDRESDFDLHHESYKHAGDERDDEVKIACHQCHFKQTMLQKGLTTENYVNHIQDRFQKKLTDYEYYEIF